MFTTVLTFVGGMIASAAIYKIISIVKKEHIKGKPSLQMRSVLKIRCVSWKWK
ncbi:hypothetical protein AAHB50_31975 [Bacillus toyonensis]